MATPRAPRSTKLVEPQLAVLVEVRGGLRYAGDLRLDEVGNVAGENFQATFTYDPSYLELALRGEAFSLDPINLPLTPAPVTTQGRYEKLGALFDAAPDAWGRTVMASDEGVQALSLQESTVLLKGRGSGVGAVLFAPDPSRFRAGQDPAVLSALQQHMHVATHGVQNTVGITSASLPGLDSIDTIYETVQRIENGIEVDDRLRPMLMSSWDMGGARPKAVVCDDQGEEWIVKFPRKMDTYSRQRVEWANLEMGRAVGMRVPDLHLHPLAGGDCALLVRRFDRLPPSAFGMLDADRQQERWRVHYLSAVSLVSPPANFEKRQMDTAFGASIFSYARIADIVRSVSSNVTHDLQELFARMVLNVLTHNTDDHLKNTGFLIDPTSRDFRYRLSPLFDVVTQENDSKHLLHIGPGLTNTHAIESGRVGSLDNVRAGAPRWGLRTQAVERIIARVQDVVAHREYYYRMAGMNDAEIAQVERWVSNEASPAVQYSGETEECSQMTQAVKRARPS